MRIRVTQNTDTFYAVNRLKNPDIPIYKEVTIVEKEKEIDKLSSKTAFQNSDIPTRIVKENANFLPTFCLKVICLHSNYQCLRIL